MFSDEFFKKLNVMYFPLPSSSSVLASVHRHIFKPYNVELQHSLQMFHFDMSALHFYLLIGNKALHG